MNTDQDLNDQEWAEFERDYARWCFEVEQDRIRILENSESRAPKSVNQNS
jgi:hypothetical protein